MIEPRVPPHNLDVEQHLLGALLCRDSDYWRVSHFLEPEHFHEPVHARIYEAISRTARSGQTPTPTTLKSYFESDSALKEIGGAVYLQRLADASRTVINAEEYARLVHDHHARRALIEVGTDIVNGAYDAGPGTSPTELIEEAERRIYEIGRRGTVGGVTPVQGALVSLIDRTAGAYHGGTGAGVHTGLIAWDRLCGAMMPGDLILLAGATGMGKTAACQRLTKGVAEQHTDEKPRRVCVFSLEMTRTEYVARYVAQATGIPTWRMEEGKVTPAEFGAITDAARQLEKLPLYIDDTPKLTTSQIRSRARRARSTHGVDLIFVDHHRKIRPDDPRAPDTMRYSQIAGDMKDLAKELEVPVLLATQMKRVDRDDKRPRIEDLYGGSALEQEADLLAFIYRRQFYLERAEPTTGEGSEDYVVWQDAMAAAHGKAEIIKVKARRNRGAGRAALRFIEELVAFEDFLESEQSEIPF